MESSKLSFKLFVENSASVQHITDVVPVFHSWIQTHAITDHLLIDVADYAHVHDGPGIVLVSHEANYSFDTRSGKLGLTYQRKQPLQGDFADRAGAALRATVDAAKLIEAAPAFEGRVKFRTDEIEFRICDRLLAPNHPETFGAIRNDLVSLFGDAKLEYQPSARELFTVTIHPGRNESLTKLSDRLATTPATARS
jgi:hypothetical protein